MGMEDIYSFVVLFIELVVISKNEIKGFMFIEEDKV